MQAYVLHNINDIRFEEVQKPVPRDGEVLVKVSAAGICGSDIPRIYSTGAHVHPIVPGHEFAGEVVGAADAEGGKWIGKRVGVYPLIPCMKCNECMNRKYEMCSNYNYLGSRCDGAFAEYVNVPLWNLIELPKEVSSETAAMLEPLSVAAHAVRGLVGDKPSKDAPVLVWGLGTIGLMTVSILKAEGFSDIICVGSKKYQRDIVVREIGIDISSVFDAGDEKITEHINEATGGRGIKYAFECVGKSETYEKTIEAAAAGAYVMLVGNPYSDMTLKRNVYWKILRKQLTVKGTWNSSFTHDENDDPHYVLELIKSGRLKTDFLITHKFELPELKKGFEIMRDKSADYIKCMTVSGK